MKRPREADDYPDTNGLTILHRSRLVPWRVAAVTCIAACPDGSVFAAGYDDGAVEVFDANLFNCLAVSATGDIALLVQHACQDSSACNLGRMRFSWLLQLAA